MNFINYSTLVLIIIFVSFVVFFISTISFFIDYEIKEALYCLFMVTILFAIMCSFNLDNLDEWQYGKKANSKCK